MIDNLQYSTLILTIIINMLVQAYQNELGKTTSYVLMGIVFLINIMYFIFSLFVGWKIGMPELVEIFPRALILFKQIIDKQKLEEKIEMQ